MSGSLSRKLSREEIARIEIGHTEVTAAQKWTLSLFFIAFIAIYPLCQVGYRQPFAEWRKAESVQQSIKAYETAIEETSLLRRWLLPPVQRLLTEVFRLGNEKVIVGRGGWLFFSADCDYLINPGFLRPEILHKRRMKGVQPDPAAAIIDFKRRLAARGIRLIAVPVPVKPMIYAEKLGGKGSPLQNPSFAEFRRRLEKEGITVIDLSDALTTARKTGESYLKTDTHWTPAGMEIAVAAIAAAIGGAPAPAPSATRRKVTNLGDIAVMLKLADCERFFPAETVEVADYDRRPQRESEVLLLGDSFANIYSAAAMKWGDGGGLAEALGARLGKPVDAILRNDAGAYATRQVLANELRRGRDRLKGKKVVVYEFAIRELVNGDWKMLDMTLGKAPKSAMLEITSPREVTATVLAATAVPRPHSAPYKDHLMSLHLGDIDGRDQAVVYVVSMRDNVWTDAARLRVGDTVRIRLEPWSAHEAEYGSWNRSEFDSEELMLVSPGFGKLAK